MPEAALRWNSADGTAARSLILGMGVHDIAPAARVHAEAREHDMGTWLPR
jgi:hypothetical protein